MAPSSSPSAAANRGRPRAAAQPLHLSCSLQGYRAATAGRVVKVEEFEPPGGRSGPDDGAQTTAAWPRAALGSTGSEEDRHGEGDEGDDECRGLQRVVPPGEAHRPACGIDGVLQFDPLEEGCASLFKERDQVR